MNRPPRFVWAFVAAALVGAFVLTVVTLKVTAIKDAEERRDCARAVASRDDARAMWLYLLDTADADPKVVAQYAKKLDELIPELRCVGGNWVPESDERAD